MLTLNYPAALRTRACLTAGAIVLLAAGCSGGVVGSGNVVTQTRPISGVEAVSLGGVGELTIVQGEPESLVIEAEDNLMPHIQTVTEGKVLTISEKDVEPKKPIRFRLTVGHLNTISSNGAGTIRSDRFTSTEPLALEISGAGNAEFSQLECASLKVELSGAGDVKLQGHAGSQELDLSGSASYAAGDFKTPSAKVKISGAGSAKVWATDALDVSISGVGSVDYFGVPKIKKEISGVGSLHSLGDKAGG